MDSPQREPSAGEIAMGTREMSAGMLVEAERVREVCAQAYDVILQATASPSREKSLALTKLEEACMWATRAIARESA